MVWLEIPVLVSVITDGEADPAALRPLARCLLSVNVRRSCHVCIFTTRNKVCDGGPVTVAETCRKLCRLVKFKRKLS